ncbi:FliM/FliN family flagellar motor switch protein [Rhodopirellula sp. SWK7]|uniref:FliM/FliN family flagellar motor switch protein n=1 Tax=Rhodopirellula sp. SWK7 TaxID=595460 RepID=UPI0005C44599|nr:FliM/FliN family flagellar motor C-terminal domain-containing protein [Rhodopirellula sp. SWK7]
MTQTETSSPPTDKTASPALMQPQYRERLLKIKTPVTVTLAERKETLRNILALVPGSMLTFDTHCDQPLELSVGGHPIATGETVKIGDKFGIRIREIGVPKTD